MHIDNGRRANQVSGLIIGRAYAVLNTLGAGFLEKVYENALAYELRAAGASVHQQYAIEIRYAGVVVGSYSADLLVENLVLVELKATKALDPIHEAQCINYLKATKLPLCLLLNFGTPRLEIKRLIGDS